jgi:hypothetical protein
VAVVGGMIMIELEEMVVQVEVVVEEIMEV